MDDDLRPVRVVVECPACGQRRCDVVTAGELLHARPGAVLRESWGTCDACLERRQLAPPEPTWPRACPSGRPSPPAPDTRRPRVSW